MMATFVASIPSPPANGFSLGPLDIRAYGFLIALGVLAGVWLAGRRLAEFDLNPEIIPSVAIWVMPAAIVGARAYFVLTNWGRFSDDIGSAFRLWEGGLGIPGGVALGAAVGVWRLKKDDIPLPPVFTAVALGLPLGQIIGRWGNWFNQELYGRPTDLPWGLEIDADHRLAGYEAFETFHPTFAYEIIWNIGLLAFLLWLDRKNWLKPGALFAAYLIGYGIGRIAIETVRIDPVNSFLGIRLHIWAMVVFIAAAVIYLFREGFAEEGEGALDIRYDPDTFEPYTVDRAAESAGADGDDELDLTEGAGDDGDGGEDGDEPLASVADDGGETTGS
ncbi:MAG: prolipoprotein diacylglyceryl transferase [Actinomycetota bacterium]